MRKLANNIKKHFSKITKSNKGIGIAELIGIAALFIIAAFVLIPGLRTFAQNVITALNTWWTNTVSSKIFPSS
ncbi:MAG: hypothetical protein QXW71_02910 [Thermoplasmata archaeon]